MQTMHDRHSPFTIPEPGMKFVEGPAVEPREPQSVTLDTLLRHLTNFADFYERATAAIEQAGPFEKRSEWANREVHADAMQRDFRACVGIDRARGYCLSHYGAELTITTANRLLGDLIRRFALTRDEAAGLFLADAMDRLESEAAVPSATNAEKKTKGKNIDARMLKVLADNKESYGWSAAQWADHLKCAESTVKDTPTWKGQLAAFRANAKADRATRASHKKLIRRNR
jgi:hypothetical protein